MDTSYMTGPSSNDAGSGDTYFALASSDKLANTCLAKASSFYNTLNANYYLDKLAKQWQFYHGEFSDSFTGASHQVGFSGEQGELSTMPVNHYRNIAQHMLVMITANRPTMEARAVNTDYKSLSQTYLANGILDYYMREKNLENNIRKATEMAIVMGAGYVGMEWNATAGELYDFDPETGEKNFEGELEFSTYSPFDVVFDGTKEDWNNEWIIKRTFKNRYNLMAKYPEFADKIMGIPNKSENSVYRIAVFSNDATDDIAVYEFYHKKTEAVPEGRYCLFLDSDIVLLDMPLPYRDIPIYRVTAGEFMGTPYGYTPMFDVFPIQEGINSLYSTIMTNQSAFGVQNVFVQRGSDLNINSLEGAMNIIEGNSAPQPLNLTQTPAEVFKFLDILVQAAETISGVNSVARGDPQASLKSGTALALVQSMALQFISGLQNNYVKLIEDVGTSLINILKDYAKTPKTIALVGKNNRPLLKEFIGDDVNSINRVIVSVGNPLARCLKKGTDVLMFDGSLEKVENIKIGQQVMGPDSLPRTIQMVNSGEEEMYDIYENNIKRKFVYGCNASHILSLKYCSDDGRYGLDKGEIVDVTVKEYLSWSERKKRLFLGFRTGVEFDKKELSVPAYILGAWIGDGTSSTTALTTMDSEMVTEWSDYAKSINMQVRVQDIKGSNKAKTYFITSGQQAGSNDRNPFINELRAMELIDNKHIPSIYKINSRQNRLELLAGLIDTDGSMPFDGTYVFTQVKKHIVDDVEFIAKSLGFKTNVKEVPSYSYSTDKIKRIVGTCFKLTIGGNNTWEIPCRLPRKQATKRSKSRDGANYSIEIVPQGIGTYYGFTLEEEPHFVLGDFTVTHNTTAGRVQIAEQLLQMGLIKDAQQYFQVLNTGSLDSMYESDMNELLLIKSENEILMDGKKVLAELLDSHSQHIMEHRTVMSDPDLRMDPNLRAVVQDHIQQHIDFLRTVDPDLLMLIGQKPLQNPNAPQQPPPVGAPPPMPPPPPGPAVHVHNHSAPQPQQVHAPHGTHTPGNILQVPNAGRPPSLSGQGSAGGSMVPGIPKPPGEFAHLSVQASDVAQR